MQTTAFVFGRNSASMSSYRMFPRRSARDKIDRRTARLHIVQRAQHGIMLEIGRNDVIARRNQSVDRDIQRLSRVCRENDMVRARTAEQLRQLCSASRIPCATQTATRRARPARHSRRSVSRFSPPRQPPAVCAALSPHYPDRSCLSPFVSRTFGRPRPLRSRSLPAPEPQGAAAFRRPPPSMRDRSRR